MSYWIDIHTHLEMIEQSPEASVEEASQSNVKQMITIGCHPQDFDKVCDISEKHFPVVAATLGVHPHEAIHYNEQVANYIRTKSKEKFIVAVGEIGLDYYYNHSPKDVQNSVFDAQLDIAKEVGLPIEIHTRDAEDDTITRLKRLKNQKGLLHCFTGTQKLCDAALEAGFYISCSGVVTFKNSEALRSVIKSVPLDRLLVETDAPFLAPVPHRGKKNVPAWTSFTGEFVAGLKGVSVAEFQKITIENTYRLFDKLPRI